MRSEKVVILRSANSCPLFFIYWMALVSSSYLLLLLLVLDWPTMTWPECFGGSASKWSAPGKQHYCTTYKRRNSSPQGLWSLVSVAQASPAIHRGNIVPRGQKRATMYHTHTREREKEV